MCEIYTAYCQVCGLPIEMHLGDWLTNQDEIEVFCKGHIPKENVVVWEASNDLIKHKKTLVGVRPLTRNAEMNHGQNHPNSCDCVIIEKR